MQLRGTGKHVSGIVSWMFVAPSRNINRILKNSGTLWGGARLITVDFWNFDPWREMKGTSRNCADALRDYFKIILDELLKAGELEGNTSSLGFPKSLFTVIHEFVAHTETPLLLFLITLGRIP